MASALGVLKEVFSNKNVLVISSTNMMAFGIFNSLWQTWWSLYMLQALGATIPILGLISMIQSSSTLLFRLPGGILADRIGRSKVIGLGTSLRILAPIIYLLAGSWQWIILATIADAATSIYMPAFNAMIAESLPQDKRATAFGAYRTMTSIPRMFMPIISGIFMDIVGIIRGVRIGVFISIVAFLAAFIARMLFLRETLDIRQPRVDSTKDLELTRSSGERWSLRRLFTTLRELLGGTILAMLVVSCVGGFGMRMVSSYLVVASASYRGDGPYENTMGLTSDSRQCMRNIIHIGGWNDSRQIR